MAMPKGLGIAQIIALVNCLAKLHNLCIDEAGGGRQLQPLNVDTHHIMNSEDGFVPMEGCPLVFYLVGCCWRLVVEISRLLLVLAFFGIFEKLLPTWIEWPTTHW